MNKCSLTAIILCAVILAVQVPNAGAQCSLTYFEDGLSSQGLTAPSGIGQSFVACQTGYVSAVTMYSSSFTDTPGTLSLELEIYIHNKTDLQNVVLTYGSNYIELDTPLPVTVGLTYCFGFYPTTSADISLNPNNPYADGLLIRWNPNNFHSIIAAYDLRFGIEILPYNPVLNDQTAWGAVKSLYR